MNYTTLRVLLRPALDAWARGITESSATWDAWISQSNERYEGDVRFLTVRSAELVQSADDECDRARALTDEDGLLNGIDPIETLREAVRDIDISHNADYTYLSTARDASISRANEWYASQLDGLRAEFMIALIEAVHLAGTPVPSSPTDGE